MSSGSLAAVQPRELPPSVPYSRWLLPHPPGAEAAEFARECGLPPIIAALLLDRGINARAKADEFFQPQMENLLDPFAMRGMSEAVGRIQVAIAKREPILIYGDYDVDGTTATVLLKTAIELLGGTVRFHVPHRIREGYGLQPEVLTAAAEDGMKLVISVDNGIRAFAAAEEAARLSLDLIVTDHHLPEDSAAAPRLPQALAILNPNQPGCTYPCKDLCGAGIAFKLAQALLEAHDRPRARTKLLPSFLKLLAIATVADAVPLLGENRIFLSLGLEQLRRPVHPGLLRLFELAQLDPSRRPLTATDLAFRIAPRINAADRMDVASDVVTLFTTRDAQEARALAEKLDRLNGDRKRAEAEVLEQIERRLSEEPRFRDALCIVIDGEGWHRGILGILSSRIVDRRGRPALVLTRENGLAHGSGRSVPGFHLLNALESCRELMTRYGGHAHAVGFSLPSENISELRSRLEQWALLYGDPPTPGLKCHAVLPLGQITPTVFQWLRRMQPFGMKNEEPVFVARHLRISAPVRTIQNRHAHLRLVSQDSSAQSRYTSVGWNWAGRLDALGVKQDSIVHLAYKLRENDHPQFGGLELEIVDLALASAGEASV